MSLNTNRHNAHKLLMKLIFCPTFNLKNREIKHRLDFYPRVSDQYAHTEQTQKLQRSPLITIFNLSQISAILSSVKSASGHHRQFDKTEQFCV